VNTGTLRWRFFTVPGNPALGFEQPVLKKAAATWSGREWWKSGGGSAWEAIVYDTELNRIYFGTDGAWPWDPKVGWGKELGDRLFTNCIVAVDADTGEYRWHYQETPGDVWDYNSTAQIMLATLRIDGKDRRVILHAPKNGFFYVLDRQTGKLLSADKFVTATWASAIDLASGRPKEAPEARYYLRPNRWVTVLPYADGAHNWQGMSFNPKTGLVYIPATDASMKFRLGTGGGLGATEFQFEIPQEGQKRRPLGRLIAWDPVAKAPRWTVKLPYAINGGTLTTAGDLVFQGTADGVFNAWNASDGHKMWSTSIVSATQAAPVTYRYRGKQYVLLAVGASGVSRAYIPEYGDPKSARGPSRLLAFALGGKQTLPSGLLAQPQLPIPPHQFASPDTIERGRRLYYQSDCFICHGVRLEVAEGGSFRDLRYIPAAVHDQWNRIVLDGQLQAAGMPSFKEALSAEDAQAIRAFVIAEAQKLYEARTVLRGQ
jgi:quinohemoprotein ethanol dehydrogenase